MKSFIGLVLLLIASPSLADEFVFRMPVLNVSNSVNGNLKTTQVITPRAKTTIIRERYRTASNPAWNLSGSWVRVRNRADLINHLSDPNEIHRFDRTELQSLTIGQLWALHDDHHNGKVIATVNRISEPTPYCPPGST